MAFRSGSSLATDFWTRGIGFPSSAQLLRVGSASRLHQHSSSKPTAHSGSASAIALSRSLAKLAFFLSYSGSGEVIQRFALGHLTPRRHPRVARTVSPETRSLVSPSSKATFAAISRVQRLLSWPNSLGERCSSPLKLSAVSLSKAERVRLGREERASRAARPRSLKSWIASRTVWEPHPKERAIREARSPLLLARMIWARRMTKASEERSAVFNCSFSVSESGRTKIGGLMVLTIASHTTPILDMH